MKRPIIFLLALVGLWACKGEDDTPEEPQKPTSPVVFDLAEVPYDKLSDYNFFDGEMVNHDPVYGVIPYDVITPLFADYAHKFRFVWMPEGARASYNTDHNILDFQDGTVLIKTFYFDNVQPEGNRYVIETRIEFMRNGQWEFAEYVWNEDQTEAVLDMDGSFKPLFYMDENNEEQFVNWRVPSEAECLTCHKRDDTAIPIGPKPQNINKDYNYPEGVRNQLLKLIDMGYLEPNIPAQIETVVPWDDPSYPLQDRVRAYLDMNCAHCHRDNSHCDYRPIRYAWNETVDPENMGICVEPDQNLGQGLEEIIVPGNPDRSVLYFRINTTDEAVRMPLLGRSVIHEEGRDLILEYINSLQGPC
jgi:uncharacterized repeat protein (TIGR03806 family)